MILFTKKPLWLILLLTMGVSACKQSDISPSELLTGSVWQVDELRISRANTIDHYKRGGTGNTVDYDTHYNVFAKDGTGTVSGNGGTYPMTWNFLGSDQTKIRFVVKFATQTVTVNWENIEISSESLRYTEYYTQDGYNVLVAGYRTPKK